MESLDYPRVHFPVVSFVVDWKLLLLLDCDELCTTLMHHFYQCPGCVPNLKLAVMVKVRGIFF